MIRLSKIHGITGMISLILCIILVTLISCREWIKISQKIPIKHGVNDKNIIALSRYADRGPRGNEINTLQVNQTLFLHMGKAGGGTVVERTKQSWKIIFRRQHPAPPSSETVIKDYLSIDTFWICLRDPIDRLVSAFYWRKKLACKQKDNRAPSVRAIRHSDQYCLPRSIIDSQVENEYEILFQHDSVDDLAASVCKDETFQNFSDDIRHIHHVRHGIGDWISLWKNNSENWYPIVLEPGFDVIAQVDKAVEWTYARAQWENIASFQARQLHAWNDSQLRTSVGPSKAWTHSSMSSNSSLSSKSMKCLTNYFHHEYGLLKEIQETKCHTQACHDAIQSILQRRGYQVSQ